MGNLNKKPFYNVAYDSVLWVAIHFLNIQSKNPFDNDQVKLEDDIKREIKMGIDEKVIAKIQYKPRVTYHKNKHDTVQ